MTLSSNATLIRIGRAVTLALAVACGGDAPSAPNDPAQAEIVTSDVANFWRAYDAGGKDGSADAFQREYLDHASAGLRDFAAKRAVTATSLAQMVRSAPRYFAAVRGPMTALAASGAATAAIRTAFARLHDLDPDAVFPPVTLLVGRFSTAGTTSASGVLIGAEFFADAGVPRDELTAFSRANVRGADSVPFVVAHESVHVQQGNAGSLRGSDATLLEQAVMEGSADFVGELASGGSINTALQTWALPREHDVWVQFKAAMNGRDVSRWLYNQGSATADWPGDLGYFVGYRIAKAFYDRQSDKRAAVREIIGARDAASLLTRSGYEP